MTLGLFIYYSSRPPLIWSYIHFCRACSLQADIIDITSQNEMQYICISQCAPSIIFIL